MVVGLLLAALALFAAAARFTGRSRQTAIRLLSGAVLGLALGFLLAATGAGR